MSMVEKKEPQGVSGFAEYTFSNGQRALVDREARRFFERQDETLPSQSMFSVSGVEFARSWSLMVGLSQVN